MDKADGHAAGGICSCLAYAPCMLLSQCCPPRPASDGPSLTLVTTDLKETQLLKEPQPLCFLVFCFAIPGRLISEHQHRFHPSTSHFSLTHTNYFHPSTSLSSLLTCPAALPGSPSFISFVTIKFFTATITLQSCLLCFPCDCRQHPYNTAAIFDELNNVETACQTATPVCMAHQWGVAVRVIRLFLCTVSSSHLLLSAFT